MLRMPILFSLRCPAISEVARGAELLGCSPEGDTAALAIAGLSICVPSHAVLLNLLAAIDNVRRAHPEIHIVTGNVIELAPEDIEPGL